MNRFQRVASAAARRPRLTLLICAAVCVACAALSLLTLTPSGSADQLVDKGSKDYKATVEYRKDFGDDAVIVLIQAPQLETLTDTQNLERLIGLEGCISGNKPAGVLRLLAWKGGACDQLSRLKPVKAVYGPGTFINSAVGEVQTQLQNMQQQATQQAQQAGQAAANAAAKQGKSAAEQNQAGQAAAAQVTNSMLEQLSTLAVRYGLQAKIPTLDDHDFVHALVYDDTRSVTGCAGQVPKARFAYLFPSCTSALIQARLKPGLSDDQRRQTIALIKRAAQMDYFKMNDASAVVTGVPVLVDALARSVTDAIWILLVAAVIVMAGVLALVFRATARLVPLAVALGSAACVFGALAISGSELTVGTIAVLPVLVGLAVDYAIQYQARVQEGTGSISDNVGQAARLGAPTIFTAAVATAVGFAVLVLPVIGSPVPMVRGFALLLVIGIGVAFVLALTAGSAVLVLVARNSDASGPVSSSVRGAGELLGVAVRVFKPVYGPIGRVVGSAANIVLRFSVQAPIAMIAAASLLAVAGWVFDTKADVNSDLQKLVPQNQHAVRDLNRLQGATGIAGEVDVILKGKDLADPKVIAWMRSYKDGLLKQYKSDPTKGCGTAELCSALSLPDLFRSEDSLSSPERVKSLLAAVPQYFSQAVITQDHKTATIAFGIKLMPFDKQQQVIDTMRKFLDGAPPGVHAELAGLPVLAAQANADLSSPSRRILLLVVGLVAVGLALVAVTRRLRALVALIPIALATGWSGFVLWATGVTLNPMSAALGALVIAISTEFSVLLWSRYEQEIRRDGNVAAAIARTYASTGRAVLASGLTAIAGFAVLAFSDIAMLRDFGKVTVVDLAVSLLGVLIVLPAVLALTGRGGAPVAAEPSERELALA